MVNKKTLIILLILLFILILLGSGYWYFLKTQKENIIKQQESSVKQKVLSYLEEKLEFCEIIKSDIKKENGSFWLICNGRPFYAEYVNGEVKYELNGWGFLKNDPVIWKDLENCDFYNSEKTDNNYNLTFYCPRRFDADKITAKIYQFDATLQKTTKIEEKDFLDILNKDIKSIYSFLGECNFKNFISKPEWESLLFLTYTCQDGDWSVFYARVMTLLPPVIMDEKLSFKDRAQKSFEKTFGCQVNNIDSIGNNVKIESSCDNKELTITYRFSDTPTVDYLINCDKPCLELGKYFILPPIRETERVNFLREMINREPTPIFYKVGDMIIEINSLKENIIYFWQKPEGFYYKIYYE